MLLLPNFPGLDKQRLAEIQVGVKGFWDIPFEHALNPLHRLDLSSCPSATRTTANCREAFWVTTK